MVSPHGKWDAAIAGELEEVIVYISTGFWKVVKI